MKRCIPDYYAGAYIKRLLVLWDHPSFCTKHISTVIYKGRFEITWKSQHRTKPGVMLAKLDNIKPTSYRQGS